MANKNGTSMVGGSVPVPPNAGINLPVITGTKIGKKSKKGSGKSKRTFKNPAGTKSGIMRNP